MIKTFTKTLVILCIIANLISNYAVAFSSQDANYLNIFNDMQAKNIKLKRSDITNMHGIKAQDATMQMQQDLKPQNLETLSEINKNTPEASKDTSKAPSQLEKTYTKLIKTYLPEIINQNQSKTKLNLNNNQQKTHLISDFLNRIMQIEQGIEDRLISQAQVSLAIDNFIKMMPNQIKIQTKTQTKDNNKKNTELDPISSLTTDFLIKSLFANKDILSLARLKLAINNFNATVKSDLLYTKSDDYILPQYGYDLFSSNAVYKDNFQGVIDDSYIIGPGDSFLINLWGSVNDNYNLEVLRDGVLALLPIGKLQVGGLNYKEAKQLINNRIKAYYKTSPPNTSVTLGDIRGITVYITGEVNHPGRYNVSARHTVMALLFLAKGVKKSGSLRSIVVKRKNGKTSHFDTYKALINGDPSMDITLLDGDVIHVPPIGKTVAITGQLIRPGIYEILGNETIKQAIKFVGGFSPTARKDSIAIVTENQNKNGWKLIDIPKSKWQNYTLKTGNIIAARATSYIDNEITTIKGAVHFPGTYSWAQNTSLLSIIKEAGGITNNAYKKYGIIKRKNGIPTDYQKDELLGQIIKRSTLSFNVDDIITGKTNVILKSGDEIIIYSRQEIQTPATVSVIGEIKNPGTYEYSNDMRLIDLIVLGGGLSADASFEKAILTRVERKNNQRNINKRIIDLKSLLNGKNDIRLQPGDELVISKSKVNFIHVKITGEVNLPGTYRMKNTDKIADLLTRANGFTDKAYPQGMIFNRESIKAKTKIEFRNMADRLEHNMMLSMATFIGNHAGENTNEGIEPFLKFQQRIVDRAKNIQPTGRIILKMPNNMTRFKDSVANIELMNGDTIYVPATIKSININGEVINPCTAVWKPNAILSDYLSFAGGITKFADPQSIYVIRTSGEILTPANYRQTLGLNTNGLSNRENHDTMLKKFKHYTSKNDFTEIPIQPGDTIYIPQNTEIKFSKVFVMRAVLSDALRVATFAKILTDF